MSDHTMKKFDVDLSQLKEGLLLMGGSIESMMQEARDALLQRNPDLARKVIERDLQVDKMEKDTDELAISILALRQPAAKDLRFVSAALKITTDMERMGDEIVNICERAIELTKFPPRAPHEDISKIFDLSSALISKSLDAFVNLSSQEAGDLLMLDDEIDQLHRKIYLELVEQMKTDPAQIDSTMKYIYVAKHLERIADHATNIAEQVIFMVEGLDIRHTGSLKSTP